LAYHGLGTQQDAENEVEQYKDLHRDGATLELAGVYAQYGGGAGTPSESRAAARLDLPGVRVAWELDSIRDEPQFKAIEARMNFSP
jgi:hypothetical protein